MRPINAKKLIKILLANDFILSRQKGSHCKPIPIGTLFAIIKQF